MVRLVLFLIALALPAYAEGNLSLTITTDPPAPHPIVGEMVNVTIRAVYDRKVANEKLEIDPSDAFDWIQTRPDNWHEERIDGLPWIIMERHLAIWPRRAGILEFGPARHRLTIIDKQSQRKDVVVEAKPLALSVGEYPTGKRATLAPEPINWHMVAKNVEIIEDVSANAARLADGEQVIRKVTLRALGVLPEHLPPRPVVAEPWLITFAAPTERDLTLTDEGPVSEVTWTWQFRPHTGEPGMLNPFRMPYFNSSTRKMDVAVIPQLYIGYASFYTGQVPKGRVEAAQIWLLAGTCLTGLILGLAFAIWRYAPQTTQSAWRRFRAFWSPALRYRMLQARRNNDWLTLRRLAEEVGQSPDRLAEIDAKIYRRPTSD